VNIKINGQNGIHIDYGRLRRTNKPSFKEEGFEVFQGSTRNNSATVIQMKFGIIAFSLYPKDVFYANALIA
jgi:hypothetical protein